MLWEVELLPRLHDPEAERVRQEYQLLTHGRTNGSVVAQASRGFLLEGNLTREQASRLLRELLVDPLAEEGRVGAVNAFNTVEASDGRRLQAVATVLLKPGVMDPVAQSVVDAAHDLDMPVSSVRTFRRYYVAEPLQPATRDLLFRKVFANEAIEQVVAEPLAMDHLAVGSSYTFKLTTVPIRTLDDAELLKLSREGQLSLNLAEMQAIKGHFRTLKREPTDVELETLAQTWSEHCSHKTLKGRVDVTSGGKTTQIDNLLKETIFGATQEIRRRLGADDWCVSVFEDNAGVVRFDERYNVCFKVETHNHPSAIEPYGGANTGLGGVIRDPLGTGLGAKPICNTDVFCFAPPDTPPEDLPLGVLHPKKVMSGVVSGVRDYGNRIGIPTVNGAVCFDARYLGNPLVFCGTVGLIPVDRCHKAAQPGDLIVAVGGRTGRDGIHGATFSSIELTAESEKVSGGAVQIGNAITEKKLLDVILQARDRGLYHAITDCGAGGFSSAIGEMGENLGAVVHLDRAPLKYDGLSYTEIWISEAQERMILAVPPANWAALEELCKSEDVEATVLGEFEGTGKLRLHYYEHQVADLDMSFLHNGRPVVVRQAGYSDKPYACRDPKPQPRREDFNETLLRILGSYNVCSKEWIIRQYDHEVQGGTVIKPLVGIKDDGPGDAAVITPVLGSYAGLAIGCGINPHYGDIDAYAMAAATIDEAVRNVVAVGADPRRIALLDNFCWGNTDRPEVLCSLVEAAAACRDVALAYNMPFISGKDSLNNEFRGDKKHITIPPTLLISAMGRVPDVRKCVTMDLKEPGNFLYLLGVTRDELGGSHYCLMHDLHGGSVPRVNLERATRIFARVHEANLGGLLRSCHDLSEGGLAVALAEMAFAGGVGADVTHFPHVEYSFSSGVGAAVAHVPWVKHDPVEVLLFAESPSRFLVEVAPHHAAAFEKSIEDIPSQKIGQTCKEPRLRIAGADGQWLIWAPLDQLKDAWQKPLRW
jgi:phosphoribosylformylglycinamidine synthase II